jgi:hypothetical protein
LTSKTTATLVGCISLTCFIFCWYNVIWFCLELQQEKMLLVGQLSLKSVQWLHCGLDG